MAVISIAGAGAFNSASSFDHPQLGQVGANIQQLDVFRVLFASAPPYRCPSWVAHACYLVNNEGAAAGVATFFYVSRQICPDASSQPRLSTILVMRNALPAPRSVNSAIKVSRGSDFGRAH